MTTKEMRERILFLCHKVNKDAYIRRGDILYGNLYAVWTKGYGPIAEYMGLASLYAFVEGVFAKESFIQKITMNT